MNDFLMRAQEFLLSTVRVNVLQVVAVGVCIGALFWALVSN